MTWYGIINRLEMEKEGEMKGPFDFWRVEVPMPTRESPPWSKNDLWVSQRVTRDWGYSNLNSEYGMFRATSQIGQEHSGCPSLVWKKTIVNGECMVLVREASWGREGTSEERTEDPKVKPTCRHTPLVRL